MNPTRKQRPDVVDYLSTCAMEGMTTGMRSRYPDASAAEVLSACFTTTKRMILSVIEMYPDARKGISETLQELLLEVDVHERSKPLD